MFKDAGKTPYIKLSFVLSGIFVILTFSGCKYILLKTYGIKNPEIENKKTIVKKALRFGLDTVNLLTVNSTDFLKTIKDAGEIPKGAIFDAHGAYIEYKLTDTSCNAGLFKFIPQLNRNTPCNKTGKTTLESELSKYRNLDGVRIDRTSIKLQTSTCRNIAQKTNVTVSLKK